MKKDPLGSDLVVAGAITIDQLGEATIRQFRRNVPIVQVLSEMGVPLNKLNETLHQIGEKSVSENDYRDWIINAPPNPYSG